MQQWVPKAGLHVILGYNLLPDLIDIMCIYVGMIFIYTAHLFTMTNTVTSQAKPIVKWQMWINCE